MNALIKLFERRTVFAMLPNRQLFKGKKTLPTISFIFHAYTDTKKKNNSKIITKQWSANKN